MWDKCGDRCGHGFGASDKCRTPNMWTYLRRAENERGNTQIYEHHVLSRHSRERVLSHPC